MNARASARTSASFALCADGGPPLDAMEQHGGTSNRQEEVGVVKRRPF